MDKTPLQIVITIDLGNESMETPDDVAKALLKLAHRFGVFTFDHLDGRKVIDDNGNTVGKVEVKY